MAVKIDASNLFSRNYLLLKRDGIKFYENSMLWGARSFRFREIGCVLMAPDHKLSFQAGNDVYSIQTKPGSAKHQTAIAALLAGVESSKLPPGSAVRYSP